MRRHLLMRILSLVLALVLIASGVLPAFAAKRTDVYNWGNMAEYSFAYGASVETAYPNGACTGLSWEETDVKPKIAYVERGGTFWYGKHWASAKNSVSASVSLKGENATKIKVDFTKISNTFLTCIMPHIADEDQKASAPRGAQLFANYVYLPTENSNTYPDYIREKYSSDPSALKFYYYLFALIQSCPMAPPTASTIEDAVADTYKSMMAFSYSRCIEDGDLKGGVNSSPAADWNIVKNKLGGMYSKGVPVAWSQMCTAGANDFQKYWEIAAFLSCLTVAYDRAGEVEVILPLTVASQGSDGRWHITFDYSSYNEYAKKYLQKVTSAGSSKLRFVNNGSSIDISADSEADITDTAELASVIINSADILQAPILCVEMQPIGVVLGTYGTTNQVDICGQQRFAVTYMPLNIRISIDPIPPSGGDAIRYEHLETFTATYNIAVNKYDSETGQGLKGAEYRITHTHDSSLLDDENWDENTISDSCVISGAKTDDDGVLTGLSDGKKGHTDVRTYSYHKGYCGGHSVPAFVEIPEEEEDEDGNITNEGEIEAAKAQNDTLIKGYFADVVLCCEMENEGGYFCKADEAGYSSSSAPATGCDSKEAYESQCANIDGAMDELEADRDEKYSKFISITYTYKVEEISAKAGYSLHGVHNDDIPLEIKKVWSSEYMDGAVRVSAISTKEMQPSAIERMFGVMTAYAAEQDIEGPSGSLETGEDNEESAVPEIKEDSSEVSSDTTAQSTDAEVPKDTALTDDSIDDTDIQAGDDDEIPEDGEIGTPSEAEAEEIENATPSETGEIDSILAAIDDIWESLLDFIKSAANGIKDTMLLAAAEVGDFFEAPLMTFGLFGAGGSSSGGTVTTKTKTSWQKSELSEVDPADNGIVSHTWIIFDHRTEGEIHLTKRDLNLSGKENTSYDSYGDSNGDGTLEGAVYGLFAAQDIVHPDGHTGVVYYKDELTAIATTDRNGDISFTAYTEAPGYVYSYLDGTLIKDPNHAAFTGPLNMHRTMGTLETRHGTEKYIGHTSKGSAAAIADYETGGGDYYYKVSSNQSHIEGITRNGSGNYRYPIYNNELNNGNCWIGRPLIVGESCASYYIKELTRSEGYELSVSGKQNLYTNGKNSYETGHAVYVTMDNRRLTKGEVIDKLALTVDVTAASDTAITDDIRIKVTGVSANINAALSETTTGTVKKIVAIPKTFEETVISTDGLPVILSGTRVEAKAGDIITTASGTYTVNKVSDPEVPTTALLPTLLVHNTYPTSTAILSRIDLESGTDEERLVAGLNEAFEANAFPAPSSEAPWIRADISGAATMEEKVAAVLASLNDAAASYATRIRFELHDGVVYIRYDHYDTVNGELTDSFCDIKTGSVYLKMDSGKGYFVYVPFSESDAVPGSWVSVSSGGYTYTTSAVINSAQIDTSVMPPMYGALDIAAVKAALIPLEAKTYWLYDGIMPELNDDGSIRKETKTRTITDADPEWGSAAYEGILWKYIDDPVEHEAVTKLSIVNKDGAPVSAADEDAYIIIPASVCSSGDTVTLKIYDNGNGNYTPSLSTVLSYILPDPGENSYIVNATLEYPGPNATMQSRDAISGKDTISEPLKVYERPIRQKIKLTKDILLDSDTDGDGIGDSYRNNTYDIATEKKLTNFRFKAYLKSNLERLYRTKDGTITWTDRNGNVMTPVYNVGGTVSFKYVSEYGAKTIEFPKADRKEADTLTSANVQKIYTAVSHNANSLTTSGRANNVWDSYTSPRGGTQENVSLLKAQKTSERTDTLGDAIKANTNLYSYDGKCLDTDNANKIREESNNGYTRILEMELTDIEDGAGLKKETESYDYEKFFDAVNVANGDKWDDNAPTYTSLRPIGNLFNRSLKQISNASRSDRVRQFAIDYYLKDETAKLIAAVPASGNTENEAADPAENIYSGKVYDEALYNAIIKAEDYLKPFFKYDLDAIYAIAWDSEKNGGKDLDITTQSLDTVAGNSTTAVSAYLPYGEYVIVEQQPKYSGSSHAYNDVLNKQYRTDKPKTVKVPSLYEGGDSGDINLNYDKYYAYSAGMDLKEMSKGSRYLIRFGQEWDNDTDSSADQSKWVIRAHSAAGDYEIYKYGLDADRMTGTVFSGSGDYAYYGYTFVQEELKPLKSYYKTTHLGHKLSSTGTEAIGSTAGGNDGASYLVANKPINTAMTANGGRYSLAELEKRLYYLSVSEDKGSATIIKRGSTVTDDNKSGMEFSSVISMTGELTAYDGEYAQMLVPWSVVEGNYSSNEFKGYADKNFRNTFYSSKLRIEKLDSETHENVLHDSAVFAIYKASRDASTGDVLFYTADTDITGSREFVSAYCAIGTVMPVNPKEPGGKYKGIVKAGTPICREEDRVILGDRYGNQISEFKSYSSSQEIAAKKEADNAAPLEYITQNVGYIKTPQPLGAGTYVLLEEKAPSGYVRTKPIAVEVYSDKITYYKEGSKDERILAAIYEEETGDETTANKNKPLDRVDVATVYVEDTPIKLEVSKVKESSAGTSYTTSDKTVSYRYSGRKDGKLNDILDDDTFIPAYDEAGRYLGWGWKKGTLEYLAALKKQYEYDSDPLTKVEIVYTGTVFAGYGYVTRPLLTADDANSYVEGATLTMYDAIQLRRNDSYEFGKSDYAFSFPEGFKNHALIIERDSNSNVKRMYVEEGYAGVKTDFVPETDAFGKEIKVSYQTGYDKNGKAIYTEGNVWSARTLTRHDTDILYYNLDSMDVILKLTIEGKEKAYGYDKDHGLVDIARLVNDCYAHLPKTDNEYSIYGYRGGIRYLEFVGGDLTKLSYSATNKAFSVDKDTLVYHLDADGNRDALIDPYTGMAYVTEECADGKGGTYEKYLVWAVDVIKDAYGNVIGMDKISTSRVATIGENDASAEDAKTVIPRADMPSGESVSGAAATYEHKETGSVTGSWESLGSGQSHHETSVRVNEAGNSMHDEALLSDNNGSFIKKYDPVYDAYGNIIYYQRSDETYDKGTDLYDRDNDHVRYTPSDDLEEFNDNAYRVNTHDELYDADTAAKDPATKELYHRYGEGYVLQNTWVTGDHTPNDPFDTKRTDGQADILKRVPYGTYIIEEVKAPEGYLKSEPVGITVDETAAKQETAVIDRTTKAEIVKLDGSQRYELNVYNASMGKVHEGVTAAGEAAYSGMLVAGAELALFKAKKVYTSDYVNYPKGYYLVKDGNTPLEYKGSEWTVSDPVMQKARWITTSDEPIYLEGIPEGFYILSEITVPEGFIRMDDVEVEIDSSREVLSINAYDDHTRTEIEKLYEDEGTNTLKQLKGAQFSLYEAMLDDKGNVLYDADGNVRYKGMSLTEWTSSKEAEWIGFTEAFKNAYSANGTDILSIGWTWTDGAHTAAVTGTEKLDASLAGGAATPYPTAARVYLTDELGRDYIVGIYGQSVSSGKKDFVYDFEYDVRKVPELGSHAITYTTAAGMRRFEYLPAGAKYVAVETNAPLGYAKAAPVLIEVRESADVYRYHVVDRESQIIISKRLEGVSEEAQGVSLKLYRAEGSALIKDAAHLVDSWVSGSEGRYTSDDAIHGRVPQGYKIGDLRAHAIKGIPTGEYYLVEDGAPAYYREIEPLLIKYDDATEIRFVRVMNEPVKGRLVITKTEEDGTPLNGASFLIRRYSKSDLTVPVWENTYVLSGSTLTIADLPVGEIDAKGNIIPYKYSVKEIVPPEGFMLNPTTYSFSFAPDKNGICYKRGDIAEYSLTVKDKETSFTISKKNFDSKGDDESDDAFTEGAQLGLYELTGIDTDGEALYDSTHPIRLFNTSRSVKEFLVRRALIAGKSYVLSEISAPLGTYKMRPIVFTISADGRKIEAVSNRLARLSFNFISAKDENPDADSVLSASVHGRYATAVMYKVTDNDGTLMETFPGGAAHVFDAADGYKENAPYTITEETAYSDGTVSVTGSVSSTFLFDKDGHYTFDARNVDSVTQKLLHADGEEIGSFIASGTLVDKDFYNNVLVEYPRIELCQSGKTAGEPIDCTHAIVNTVTVLNPDHVKGDAEVIIELGPGTDVIDEGTGVFRDGKLYFVIEGLEGYTEEELTFITRCTGEKSIVKAAVNLNKKTYTAEKTVPTVKPNNLTIHNELTGSGKEIYAGEESSYRIRLWYRPTGEELKGSYHYAGSKTGYLRSGDTITLCGNEWIRIDSGVYEDVYYEIERIADGLKFNSIKARGSFSKSEGAGALFTRSIANTAQTAVFKCKEAYDLIEETRYTDGGMLISNRLRVKIDADGRISSITAFDKDTAVSVEKRTPDGEMIAGCQMELYDSTGTLIKSFESGKTAEIFTAEMLAQGKYRLSEKRPADGYAYAKDVSFTVTGDGINKVVMVDLPTHVSVSKQDIITGTEIPGCTMAIYHGDKLITQWVSGSTPKEITGILVAGETYTLHEQRPADGYAYAEDVTFTVSLDGSIDRVKMEDQKTIAVIRKVKKGSSPELLIGGAVLQVIDASTGLTVYEWTTVAGTEHRIEGVLLADHDYILREKTAPTGYQKAGDIAFHTERNAVTVTLTMEDDIRNIPDPPVYSSRITIKKVGPDGKGLAGASIKVTADGAEREVTVTDGGKAFTVFIYPNEKLEISEIKAPTGYLTTEKTYHIETNGSSKPTLKDGDEFFTADEKDRYCFILKNNEKIGRLKTGYRTDLIGEGDYWRLHKGDRFGRGAKTGDDSQAVLAWIVFIMAGAIAAYLLLKTRKGTDEKKEGKTK